MTARIKTQFASFCRDQSLRAQGEMVLTGAEVLLGGDLDYQLRDADYEFYEACNLQRRTMAKILVLNDYMKCYRAD